ncbi:MAG: alkaline phosphatase family protein [Mucilaginibacter polytrichastri]|nr:alkaline phosphatase family protein [Mucilaginibacter polytrichastri]
MKKHLLFLLGFLFPALLFAQTKHVVIVTIDGFRPDFYLDEGWNAPNLKAMVQEGFHAGGVNSVFPSMTYPSHTTIVTGVQPAKHGIYYNDMFVADTLKKAMYWNYSSIKTPTLWKAVHDRGGKVASLFWPVSAEAPVDYNIPDNGSMGEENRVAYTRPAGFIDDLKKNVFWDTAKIDYGTDHEVAKIAAYVIEKDEPELMTVHFFSVDHFQHMHGRENDTVRAAVSDADQGVSIIREALRKKSIEKNTLLIVTGDHGFVDLKSRLQPNVWLREAGLITDLNTGNWKARFFSVGGSSYLYLKNRSDKASLKKVEQILAQQPDSVKKLFRIIDRKKLNEIGGDPEVELALSGENNASFGNGDEGAAIVPAKGGAHGYFPDFKNIRTGFIAVGSGVKKGGSVAEMNERDINAIAAKALGLHFPTEGKVPANLFVP